MRDLEEKSFLLLVILVTAAFVWILWPFSGAILWGTVLAIVFRPLYRRILQATGERPNSPALVTVAIIVFIVVLPVIGVAAALVRQAVATYKCSKAANSIPAYSSAEFPRYCPDGQWTC